MKRGLFRPTNRCITDITNCIGYVEMQDGDETEGWFGLAPNGTSNLTISLNENSVQYDNEISQTVLNASSCQPAAIKRTSQLKFINLQLKPFGLYQLTGIPMSELRHETFTMDQLIPGSEYEELLDRMLNAHSVHDAFVVLESFLVAKIDPQLADERTTHVERLIRTRPDQNMDQLGAAVCLSPRRLRQLFFEHTGFSPNHYRKIRRFNRAMSQMNKQPNKCLTEIAYANHYYDQAHFIRDFKEFAGITPGQFRKKRASIADFYNFNLKGRPNLAT